MYNSHYNYKKKKIAQKINHYLQKPAVSRMKLKQMMCIKTFKKAKISLILASMEKSFELYNKASKNVIGKIKDGTRSLPAVEFVGLK